MLTLAMCWLVHGGSISMKLQSAASAWYVKRFDSRPKATQHVCGLVCNTIYEEINKQLIKISKNIITYSSAVVVESHTWFLLATPVESEQSMFAGAALVLQL